MKSKTALFLDNLILGVVIFLFAFLVARYYADSLYTALFASFSISLAILMLIKVKSKKLREKERDNYYALLCINHFIYFDEEYATEYFFTALKKRYDVYRKRFFLRIKDSVIVVNLSEPLKLKQAVYYYAEAKRENVKNLIILTSQKEKDLIGVNERLKDIKIEIFERDRVYRLLKSLDSLPKTEEKKLRRIKYKNLIVSALEPKKSKGYLFLSFTLLFGAYFSLFSIYFIVFSAISLTLALVSKLNLIEKFINHDSDSGSDSSNSNSGLGSNSNSDSVDIGDSVSAS